MKGNVLDNKSKFPKIFITGVAGFLGSHIADCFLQDNYEVVGCDNLIGGDMDNVPKGVIFHNVDCNNLNEFNKS